MEEARSFVKGLEGGGGEVALSVLGEYKSFQQLFWESSRDSGKTLPQKWPGMFSAAVPQFQVNEHGLALDLIF